MSNCKRRACLCALVILSFLAGFCAPALIPDDNPKALAQSTGSPDLTIESIDWSPGAPKIGDTVTFSTAVKNQGDSQSAESYVAYYIDDVFVDSVYTRQINPDMTITNTLTWKAQAGEHIIRIIADCNDSILEADEANNEEIYAFTVLAPDLVIEEITWTPEDPLAGEKVTFTVTVKNRGNYQAAAFNTDLYIDGNPRYHRLVMPIDPEATANVTYPWIAQSGSHTLRAVADVLHQVKEANEGNNDLTKPYATAAPDLIINSITWTPEDRSVSDNVTFTVTIKNQGVGIAGSSILAYYIDDVCQSTACINRLNPDATATGTFSQILGGNAHTFKAIADVNDSVAETDETNNSETADVPAIAPDLIIQSISCSPTQPLIAHKTTFTITIKNQGLKQANFADVHIYIDNTHKIQNHLTVIPAGSTATTTFSWVTQGSSITIRVVVDPDNYVNESNESNNELTETVTFTTSSPTADLVIESIVITPENPSVEDTVTITASIKNNGSGQASPSHVAYYIDDILLDSVYVHQINAGATVTNKVTWPVEYGTHTVRAVADGNDSILEVSESNNEMTLVLSIHAPDLFIQGITWSPLAPSNGDETTFTLNVTNCGDIRAGGSYVSYYIDGVYRGNHYIDGIDPDTTVTRTFTWKAQSESLVFKAILDKADEIIEGNESNNERVLVIPTPDLTIEGVTWSPAEPSENSTVTFIITVRNIGSSPADSPYLYCYIDDTLKTSLLINTIAAGSSATGIFNWTAQAGEHILKAIADGNDSITESDESNNTKAINLLTHEVLEEVAPEPESVEDAEPEVATESTEPADSVITDVEIIEELPAETQPADNMTDEEDIAANLADDASSGWQDILTNKFIIFGAAGLGGAVIAVLLILRRRAKNA